MLAARQLNAQIYDVDFNSDVDGTKNGAAGIWTTDVSDCILIPTGAFEVQSNEITGEDTDGLAVWKTQSIDISSDSPVKFSLDLDDDGGSTGSNDTVFVYYSVDGGTEVLVFKGIGSLASSPTNITSLNISGTSLVISVKMNVSDVGEKYTLDNILVESFTATTYYSITDGNWNNGNTWSLTGHSGLAAGSYPDADDVFVVVGDNDVVTFNGTYAMANLTVVNATLQFSGNNRIVDLVNNGTVDIQAGGRLDRNGTNGSRLRYQSTGLYNIISNGDLFELGRINTNLEESVLTMSGGTDINLNQHLNYNDPGTEIVYSGTATFSVPNIRFKNINNKFTNNGTTLVTNQIQRLSGGTDGAVVTNNVGASLTVNGNINCNNNEWEIVNYGTFDFNGIWTNIIAGEVNFYNYAGATFNYSGSNADDDDLYLYADYATNTINYDRAGDQDVVLPQDNYSNLTISGSGTKTPTSTSALDINGDLTLSSGTLDANSMNNDVLLAGNWNNTGGAFSEGTETVTLDGSSDQLITNASGESFYNLTVSKPSGTASIESSSDVAVNNSFTMTQGTFDAGTRTLDGAGNFISTGGDVQFQKIGVTIPQLTGTVTCTGGTLTINGSGNQTIRDTPGAEQYYHFILDGSGTKTLSGNVDVNGNLSIASGVTFDVSTAPYNVNLAGNWSNLGAFSEQTGTVTLDGSSGVSIVRSSGGTSVEETFYDLAVNNSTGAAAVTLNSDVRVSNQVTFTAGHLISSAASTFIMSSGAVVGAVSNGSHVVGPMEKDMTSTTRFDFPIGDGIAYRSAGITPAGTGATTYQIEYTQDKQNLAEPTAIDHISEVEYWTVQRNAGSENCRIRLYWDANSLVDNSATLSVVNYDGTSDWADLCSGCSSGTDYIEQGSDFTFGTSPYFTFGCNVIGDNPLAASYFSTGGGGDWDDPAKWSYSDGGSTCSCTPVITSKVTITSAGSPMNINVAADVKTLTVENGATLQWTSGNDLTINRNGSLTVNLGGTMDRNSNTGAIDFATTGGQYTITNDGSFDVYDMLFSNSGGTASFAGTADMSIQNNLSLTGSNLAVTNGNTGTVSVGAGDLLFQGSNQSLTNNGTLNLGGNLQFESSNGTLSNSGSMNITADLITTGASSGSEIVNSIGNAFNLAGGVNQNNVPLTINNSGTFDLDGDFSNVDAGEGLVYNLTGSTFNFAGSTASDVDVYLYANYAGNTFEYDRGGNQNIMVPQDNYVNLNLSGSGDKVSQGNLDIDGDLEILGTATLDVNTGSDAINLSGNWTSTGTFDEGSQTVTFDGTSDQTITNSSGETFYNLVVNKTVGNVVLSSDIIIQTGAFLSLTRGLLQSSSSNTITIQDNAGIIGGSDDSYVDGPLTKEGDDDFTYQVGKGGRWSPVGIDGNSEGESFSVEYFNTSYSSTSVTGALNSVSSAEYWDITEGGLAVGNDADIKLYFKDQSYSGISNSGDLTVAYYNGSDWEDVSQAAIDFSDPGWIQSTGVNSFGAFTFGSNSGLNTLPVELMSFLVWPNETNVELTWSTASEVNNDNFIIEKSMDRLIFEPIGMQVGKGNSSEITDYYFMDEYPSSGLSYYRLKQTDFDGKESYSKIESVYFDSGEEFSFNVYPNPNEGLFFYIDFNAEQDMDLVVLVYDTFGKEVHRAHIKTFAKQQDQQLLIPQNKLPQGVYVAAVQTNHKTYKKKMVVQ